MGNGSNGAVVVADGHHPRRTARATPRSTRCAASPSTSQAGKLTAVMGPSGSGKSTLMHILAGLDKPTSGTVKIAGTEITTLGDNDLTKLRRQHIGFVFQFFNLLPMLTARGEHPAAADDRRREARRRRGSTISSSSRARRPARAPPGRALRRPAAARRDRARARLPADRRLRRRADRQPRLHDEWRDPRAAAPLRRRLRPDDGDGHARRPRRRDGRPGALPRRRPDRARSCRARARTTSCMAIEEIERPMTRFALRGLLGRKLRTVLTALAIILGVAMVSGTFVLTDSITGAFDSIFASTYQNTDAVITGKSAFNLRRQRHRPTRRSTSRCSPKVKALPDVGRGARRRSGRRAPDRQERQGDRLRRRARTSASASIPTQPQFNSLTLVKGAWPKAGEVIVDKSTAGKKHLAGRPDDRRAVARPGACSSGSPESPSTAPCRRSAARRSPASTSRPRRRCSTRRASSTRSGSRRSRACRRQSCSPRCGRSCRPARRCGPATRRRRRTPRTSTASSRSCRSSCSRFGGVALFVGSFVIANSLSITIAQRTREFATLRTLGASRRQVLGSVLLESLVIGRARVGRSGSSSGSRWPRASSGSSTPSASRCRTTACRSRRGRSSSRSLVGIVVTVLASLRPAFRATRVPPIAAVREGAVLPPGRFARFRPVGSVAHGGARLRARCSSASSCAPRHDAA